MSEPYKIPVGMDLFALVDEWDLERVLKYRWDLVKAPRSQTCYAATMMTDPATKKRRTVYMHVFLMGRREGFVIDHRDGNGLNNSRSNLRWATPRQNAVNRGPSQGSQTGFKGVHRQGGRFVAQITREGKAQHIGSFETAEEAAYAYNLEALKADGSFARLNPVAFAVELRAYLRSIPRMPPLSVEVLTAIYGEGLSKPEVGAKLGLRPGMVRKHLHRGHAALKDAMGRRQAREAERAQAAEGERQDAFWLDLLLAGPASG